MKYDITLKELFQTPPRQLVRMLVGEQAVEWLTVEFPTVRMRRPDLVVRLADGRILHLELQSGNDPDMAWRMLEYYILIRRLFGQSPVQIVLYVGDEPAAMSATLDEPNLRYGYQLTDMREYEAGPLLDSSSVDDNLLAILGRFDDPRAVIRRILERIAGLPSRKRRDYLTKLFILSGLRRLRTTLAEEVKHMPRRDNQRRSQPLHAPDIPR